MNKILAWWRARPTWQKWALAIPIAVILIAALAARLLGGKGGSGKIVSAATDAIDSTATAAGEAIKTIEVENEAINDRANGRTDAVVDAASEQCGQFDSAADFLSDSRDRRGG